MNLSILQSLLKMEKICWSRHLAHLFSVPLCEPPRQAMAVRKPAEKAINLERFFVVSPSAALERETEEHRFLPLQLSSVVSRVFCAVRPSVRQRPIARLTDRPTERPAAVLQQQTGGDDWCFMRRFLSLSPSLSLSLSLARWV